jgi:hypothetical protein
MCYRAGLAAGWRWTAGFPGPLLLGVCALVVGACAPQSRPPRLVLSASTVDLGHGKPGEVLTGTIRIANAGGTPLHVEKVELGCGCATADPPPGEVPPDGTATLTVRVRLKAEGRRLSFPVRIFSDDPATPEAVCSLSVEVVGPPLRTDPRQLNFERVALGTSPVRSLTLFGPDDRPWPADEPLVIEAESGLVRVEPPAAAEPGVLRLRPRPDLPLGAAHDVLQIRPRAGGEAVRVPVHVHVVPRTVVSPNVLYFGGVDRRGKPVQRYVLVQRTDGSPLGRVRKTEGPAGLRVAEAGPDGTAGGDATRRFQVTLDPSTFAGEGESSLSLWLGEDRDPVAVRVLVYFAAGP